MRQRLLKAITGEGQWSREGRSAIASVLLVAGSDNLLAQLGFLAKVRIRE
jgi:hypothetical protein